VIHISKNFHVAPPPKTVDGLLAVPIDIESIVAVFTFDGSTETASADATITYTVGPTAGNPIFDLRQDITQAWLDSDLFPIAQLAHHDFGAGPITDLRVIEATQAAGSVPRELVPPASSHTCLLASVITRGDDPVASRHVWEQNNLAQKNLTIVDLLPNTFMILPIVIANWRRESDPMFDLEVWKPRTGALEG
jgi:hypothetical protein